MRFFRSRAFARHQRRLAGDVLRRLRLDLPAGAVLPDRRRATRRSRPACARCRGPACRCSSRRSPACCRDRIGSRPLMATGLALQAVAIGWLAVGLDADVAYGDARDPVRHGRHRHGARVRARGQRRARRGAARGGRPGVRRDQRDPRARRRARRRGAGLGVRRPRLLRVAAGLHRRHDERGLGRRRRAGRRRAARAAGPRQAARGGRGRSGAPEPGLLAAS